MGDHTVKGLVRLFRQGQLHDFHLVKLVQTVQAPHILAVGSGLAAEALGISRHLYREVLLRNYAIAINIGNRNLGGRYHIELVKTYIIHLLALVRKLSGCKSGVFIDHQRRLDFKVSGLCVAVQEI